MSYTFVDSVRSMGLGANVGKLVKARGLSYGDVAAAVGTDPQAIWNLVKRSSKRSEFAGKLSDYFGVPMSRLMADDFAVDEAQPSATPRIDVRIEEGEAIVRLRRAHPDWRRYVLGLAMVDNRETQELLLRTMREAVPNEKVEAAYGQAPHVRERTAHSEPRPSSERMDQRTRQRRDKSKASS